MANNEVRIKVVLDSDEAKSKLAELKSQIESTIGTSGGSSGVVAPNIGVATSPTVVSSSISGTSKNRKDGEETGNSISKVLQNNGYKIGTAIGSAVGSIASKVIGDQIEISYLKSLHAGENNTSKRIEHSSASGGLQGAMWGIGSAGLAMAILKLSGALAPFTAGGSLLIGGTAAAALGVGGYMYGRNNGRVSQEERERYRLENADEDFTLSLKKRGWQQDRNFGMMAFDRQLQMKGSREMRIEAILEKEDDLVNGKGANSIGKLMANRARMRAAGDTESMAYKENEAKLGMQLSTYEQLEQKLMTERLKPRAKPWQGSDFSDSMSAKGLYIGAQVSVADANKPIVDILSRIERSFDGYARRMGSRMGGERSTVHGAGAFMNIARQGGVALYSPNN